MIAQHINTYTSKPFISAENHQMNEAMENNTQSNKRFRILSFNLSSLQMTIWGPTMLYELAFAA